MNKPPKKYTANESTPKEDFGATTPPSLDAKTGEFAFRHKNLVAKSQLLYADGKLIILDEDGWLYIATPTSDGITIHAKARLLDRVAWTAPSLVGKRLFIRDKKKIMALDLS